MKKVIIVTDLTRMSKTNVCVAGYTEDGTCIRPVLRHGPLQERFLWSDNNQPIIRPFAIVEFDVLDNKLPVTPPHTEDWPIRTFHRVCHRLLSDDERKTWLDKTTYANVEAIFGATLYGQLRGYVIAGEGQHSLGTIVPQKIHELHFDQEYGTYRLHFIDRAGKQYDLSVNDMALRDYLYYSRLKTGQTPDKLAQDLTAKLKTKQIYLRIGLARHFPKQANRCYVQVTGVYSFPDYLEGRCFADFVVSD